MSVTLLICDFPLLACLPFTLGFNLELGYLVLAPTFIVYAVCSIIRNAPTNTIVQQVDYIVWRVIFLTINLILVNFAIWYPLIVLPDNSTPQTSAALITNDDDSIRGSIAL